MKAYILNEAGGVENLKLTEIDKPVVKENEVLVKVKTIAINPVDVKSRASEGTLSWLFAQKRPVILGWDIAGEVVEAGAGVSAFNVEDKVFGMVNFPGQGNAYAEYVAVPADQLAGIPQNISFEEAAGATLAALTALQSLRAGNVRKGDKVLIHGASGGVGHYAVQLAKWLGAYVVGTSSEGNKDFVLELGADQHVDYASARFESAGDDFDFILDSKAGETLSRSLKITKKGGTVVSIPSSNLPESDRKAAEELGIHLIPVLVSSSGEDMNVLAELLTSGKLRTHIHKVFKFEELREAHTSLELGKVRGKIVIGL